MKERYLLAALVHNTHGVRGALRIEHLCDSLEVFAKIGTVYLKKGEDYLPFRIRRTVPYKHLALLELEGIERLEDAFPFKGCELYALREDIPLEDGAYFLSDLIGLPVIDAHTGKVYGTVREINDAPATRLFVIDTAAGEVLLPDVPAFIDRAEPDKALFVTPIEGFFTESEE